MTGSVRGVTGAKESLGAGKQVVMVLVPADPRATLRKARVIVASSLTSAVASWKAPGMNAGLPSWASASDRSGVRQNRSLSGS